MLGVIGVKAHEVYAMGAHLHKALYAVNKSQYHEVMHRKKKVSVVFLTS